MDAKRGQRRTTERRSLTWICFAIVSLKVSNNRFPEGWPIIQFSVYSIVCWKPVAHNFPKCSKRHMILEFRTLFQHVRCMSKLQANIPQSNEQMPIASPTTPYFKRRRGLQSIKQYKNNYCEVMMLWYCSGNVIEQVYWRVKVYIIHRV